MNVWDGDVSVGDSLETLGELFQYAKEIPNHVVTDLGNRKSKLIGNVSLNLSQSNSSAVIGRITLRLAFTYSD